MAKKVNIICIEEVNDITRVYYETGTVKEYPTEKLPKTVQRWIDERLDEIAKAHETAEIEAETTKAAEIVAEVEAEENNAEEAGTAENVAEVATDEREESTMKKSGAYEHELLKLARNRERREKITGGIFWNLETVVLMLTGLTLTAAAAIVYGLAVAASWAAQNIPAAIRTAQKATQKATEATKAAAEVATDIITTYAHIGRKAATVAAGILTMITR